jgi:hypothetical protein
VHNLELVSPIERRNSNLHFSGEFPNAGFGQVSQRKHGVSQSFLVNMRRQSIEVHNSSSSSTRMRTNTANRRRYLAQEVRLVLCFVSWSEQRHVPVCAVAISSNTGIVSGGQTIGAQGFGMLQ